MRICTAKGHGPVLFLPKRCAIDAGNGAPGRVLGPGRRVRRCRRVATYLRCSRDAPRGPPCLRPIGGCPRTPAPSRAWRARLPHLPRDFPACRCAAQRGSGGRPWAPRCAYHASRRSLGFVRFRTKGLGRAGASRRARTHRFPAVINRVSETPAWKCFRHRAWILYRAARRPASKIELLAKKTQRPSPHTSPDTPNERRHG